MQFPGSDNAGHGSDILWPELMSEGKETLLEKESMYLAQFMQKTMLHTDKAI